MLDVLIGVVVGFLVVGGVLVMLGPNLGLLVRRARNLRRARIPSVFQAAQPRAPVSAGVNPKTQRVLDAAARLGTWLRAHGREDLARELRGAAARLTGDEAAGLYAMQSALQRLRSLSLDDANAQQRLKSLTGELRTAVQDRFEQLELLPFKRP